MQQFNDTKILVVGGAGFVGSNLIKLLLESSNPKQIVVVDNLLSAEIDNIPNSENILFIKGSIAEENILQKINDDFDYIFHLATYHGNQSSIHDPIADHANNTITTLKLLNHIKEFTYLKKIVYSGAGCAVAAKDVTNGAQATSEDASISLEMDSPYSISKIVGEFYSVYFHKQHSVPTVRARFQNVYGPGEVLGAGQWRGTPATVWRNVTPTFIFKSLKQECLTLENEGKSSRDFIFVKDICRGLLACALKGSPGEVYNLSSGTETSIAELAQTINTLTENPTTCELKPRRDWDHSICRYGSTEKAQRDLDFKTEVSLKQGLQATIEWTKENLLFIEKCISKHADKVTEYNS
ncbi:MAG: NAD-dependent epimerase/dehydratase family protein [Lentisphaeraceae bacterium]|nr:NAD-dependent epimerase/dehydratase family protein [Lentisphaeraceae bacterium]